MYFLTCSSESEEEEIRVLNKLKETVDKQREQIRNIQREMSQKAVDCEAVSLEVVYSFSSLRVITVSQVSSVWWSKGL